MDGFPGSLPYLKVRFDINEVIYLFIFKVPHVTMWMVWGDVNSWEYVVEIQS